MSRFFDSCKKHSDFLPIPNTNGYVINKHGYIFDREERRKLTYMSGNNVEYVALIVSGVVTHIPVSQLVNEIFGEKYNPEERELFLIKLLVIK